MEDTNHWCLSALEYGRRTVCRKASHVIASALLTVAVGGVYVDTFVVVNKCLIDNRCHISKTPSRMCLHWVRNLHISLKENAHIML